MSKGSSAPAKSPASGSHKSPATGSHKLPKPTPSRPATASGKAKRSKTEASAAPAAAPAPPPPPAAPVGAAGSPPPGAAPLVRPELTAIALETSARVKRQRVLDIIIPMSTSARMAEAARASVWAISSEKTTMQFSAAEAAAEAAEDRRSDALVDTSTPVMEMDLRRSKTDLYAFLRDELERPEDDPRDPHGLWRRAHKRLRHELSTGPAPEELLRLEERLQTPLPPSFWDFSLEWGGGLLYVHEFGAVRIIPALEILSELKGPLCGRMRYPSLPVVDLGCGDYLALDMSKETKGGERPVVWWYAGEVKKKVADSFVAWLKRLVETHGQCYWWEP